MIQEKKPIGRILLEQRAVSAERLEQALSEKGTPGRLASRLTEQGVIDDVEALKALSEQFGIPGIDLNQICLRLEDLDILPKEIAEKHLLLPVLTRDESLFVAMGNPTEKKVIDELEFVTGKRVYSYVALESVLSRVIQAAYARKARGEEFYVGPRCPPETLARFGIESSGARRNAAPDAQLAPRTEEFESIPPEFLVDESQASEQKVVVVGDAVRRSSQQEIAVEDFGNLSHDVSVVTELPLASSSPAGASGAMTVLVVDDDADIRKMVTRLLVSRGLNVIEADRGNVALRLLKENNPKLIVLDAMLPEVHGFDIARRIKKSERFARVPIIMISAIYRGWRFAEDVRQGCGVDYFFEKPFRIDELLRAVDAALAGIESGTDGARSTEDVSAEAEQELTQGIEAYKAGRLDDAIAHLKQGSVIDPLAYRLHFHLGLLYGKKGQVYEAIGELERAMELNSKHFAAAKNLAILYQKAGFRHKASEAWERALGLAPDEETRQSIKQHLLNLL
jgi:DNA-binding response OmpR family regulator